MSGSIVISQPMLMPWRGMFEQIKLSDVFVFYDDIQLPFGGGKGRGYLTRVQVKTSRGIDWISLPVHRAGKGKQLACEAIFAEREWKSEHLGKIYQAYRGSPFYKKVYREIVEPIYKYETRSISDFCVNSMKILWQVLGLDPVVHFSSTLDVPRDIDASLRVLEICKRFNADAFVSGLGAMNYIDYSLFEDAGIKIHYMDYQLTEYPQLHGAFTPFVSVIDLLFNVGPDEAGKHLNSGSIYWKDWPAFEGGRPVRITSESWQLMNKPQSAEETSA